jgi:hypothetical protein
VQLSAPARWRQGRCPVQPLDVFGGRCCVRRAGRQRVARIHPDTADARNASLSTRSIAALRGMGLRIVEPRASEICFALQSCRLPALLTMLIIDEARSSSSTYRLKCIAVWHSTLKTTTMFSFLVTSCFTLVAAQLEMSQHIALMDLYDALGSNKQPINLFFADGKKKNVFSSGCSLASCPRFAATAPCSGGPLTCSGSNVTVL